MAGRAARAPFDFRRPTSRSTPPPSLRGFVRRQIRARTPLRGAAAIPRPPGAPARGLPADGPGGTPLGLRAHALQPTNRGEAVPRLFRFGAIASADGREEPMDLTGRVALVAGATRGAGRGIATELGAAGATVYVTGRSTRAARSEYDRPETIEETAELVDGRRRARHRRRRRPPRPGRRSRRSSRGSGRRRAGSTSSSTTSGAASGSSSGTSRSGSTTSPTASASSGSPSTPT